jgi:hypothetical protein
MRCRIALALSIVGALVVAAPAGAAIITESRVHVTSPTGTYIVNDELVPSSQTISGTGTSNGNASNHVDIKCFFGKFSSMLKENVAVAADGTFTFSGPLGNIAQQTCVLRAVDHTDATDYPPGSPSMLEGPTLAVGERNERPVVSGPNAGKLRDFFVEAPQLLGDFNYDSMGGCTINFGYVYDAATFEQKTLEYCNAWFNTGNGPLEKTEGFTAPTRSELRVDGHDAYLAAGARYVGGGGKPFGEDNSGFPLLSYSYSLDPATGDVVLESTNGVVTCAPKPAVYPATEASCSSFAPTGVRIFNRIVQGHSGRVASVLQRFESDDGAPHEVDLLEDNEFWHENKDGELNFPWTGLGASTYTIPGQAIPAPPGGPGSFYVKGSAAVADGGEEAAQGAVTFSNPPEGETIVGTTNNKSSFSWVDLRYKRTVTPTAPVSLGFTYSHAFLLSELGSDAAAAQASYLPSVTIGAPASGSKTSTATAVVLGTAGDATGLASLSVNGAAVPVAANGSWSASVPLSPGANTITATATNVFGYASQAQVSVTYSPPAPIVTALSLKGKLATSSRGVSFTVSCLAAAGASCKGVAQLTSTERLKGHRVTGLSARKRTKRVTVGRVTFTVAAGKSHRIVVTLNRTGQALLKRFHSLPVTLAVTLTNGAGGKPSTVARTRLVIKLHKKRH